MLDLLAAALRTLVALRLNEPDRAFGTDLLRMAATWTSKQRFFVWKLCKKYRKQLGEAGIAFDAIPVPLNPAGERQALLVDPDTAALTYRYAGAPRAAVTQAVAKIPGVVQSRRHSVLGYDVWYVGVSLATIDALVEALHFQDFDVDAALMGRCLEVIDRCFDNDLSGALDAELEVPGLGIALMGFQKAGVAYGLRHRRFINADDPGLGKSLSLLALAQKVNAWPVFVIAPAYLRLNWIREVLKCVPGKTVSIFTRDGRSGAWAITHAGQARRIPLNDPSADVLVVSYEALGDTVPLIGKRGKPLKQTVGFLWPHVKAAVERAQVVAADESHYIANPETIRAKCALVAAEGKPYRVAMSGTPVRGKPVQLVGQLAFIGRLAEFGGKGHFEARFCGRRERVYGGRRVVEANGATRLFELNSILRRHGYVRHARKQVMPWLPDVQVEVVTLDLDNRAEYRRAEDDIVGWLVAQVERDPAFLASIADLDPSEQEEAIEAQQLAVKAKTKRAQAILRLGVLRQLAAQGKMAAAQRWIEGFLDAGGDKLLVFGTFRWANKALADHFGWDVIMGGISDLKRDAAKERFQNDPAVAGLVLNHIAGGAGLTLTASSDVCLFDCPWYPTDVEQDVGRAYGRLSDPHSVVLRYCTAEESIDNDMMDVLEERRAVVDAVRDGAGLGAHRQSVTGELIKRLIARVRLRQQLAA